MWIVISLAVIAVIATTLIMFGKVLDRVRHVRPDEKFAGWYQGKSHTVRRVLPLTGAEYDSMNDHGYSGPDGGLWTSGNASICVPRRARGNTPSQDGASPLHRDS